MVQSNIEFIQQEFKNKLPQQLPTFYITYGPPASGKGGIMKKVLEKDNVESNTIINVVIDDIVMSTPGYKEERDRLLSEGASKDEMQRLYWSTRKIADSISDALLNTALLGRYNISWETNGRTIAWIVKEVKRIQRQNYNTVVVYPWVPIYSRMPDGKLGSYDTNELSKMCPPNTLVTGTGLLDRAVWRQECFGQEAAPEKQIVNDAMLAQENIVKLLDIVDKIYLYDNSGSYGEDKLIFSIENVYEWTSESDPYPGFMISENNKFWASAGHSYLVHCFANCEDIRILESKGMKQELINVLNKFCCEPMFVEDLQTSLM